MTRLETLCVHGPDAPKAGTPLVPPLVQSTAHRWGGLDEGRPLYSYAREGNETVAALERRLGALEGGAAVCTSSGLSSLGAILDLLPAGSRVVAGRHLYGGTTRLLNHIHRGRLTVSTVDTTRREEVEDAFEKPAALLLVETPSNPTLAITDLRHAIRCAHAAGALAAVDNTFLTPLSQRPLDLGADAVVHSTTKYFDGHNATLGGAVVVHPRHRGDGADPDGALEARLRWVRQATGTNLAPFEAWLTIQGSKTLHLRVKRQWETAARVASEAEGHPGAVATYYPGLESHPGHRVHRSQATGDGGIVTLDFGSLAAAGRFVSRLGLFTLAENLGAAESLASSPALMTHASLGAARRAADGITDGLVRLSVGIEDPEDIVQDVRRALAETRPLVVNP
ncbi:MAG: trans-sulfuration enzyme family protein [Thermoplasmatota archaeon]